MEREEKMETAIAEKLQSIFQNIFAYIEDKEAYPNYIAELHEFPAKEYFGPE